MQSNVDSARRNASDSDKKLKSELVKVAALTDEVKGLKAEIAKLKSELSLANTRAGVAEQRIVKGVNQERQSLKRAF